MLDGTALAVPCVVNKEFLRRAIAALDNATDETGVFEWYWWYTEGDKYEELGKLMVLTYKTTPDYNVHQARRKIRAILECWLEEA